MESKSTHPVTVKELIIKIGDKEIKLSVEDAKSLMKILEDVFGETKTITISPSASPTYIPYPYPVYPYTPYPTWTTSWTHDNLNYTVGTMYLSLNKE